MKKIFKYQIDIEDTSIVEMPVDAKILCVQLQFGIPCIWALVDDAVSALETKVFVTFGTGHDIPYDLDYQLQYIGTYQLQGGALVFHVFEKLA